MRGSKTTVVETTRGSLSAEMAVGDLGDVRLNARRDRLIAALEQHPDVSFPEACGGASDVEACYRFLRNPRISLETVIEPHLVATRARCQALGTVLVIHDTTEMSFAGEEPRAGLSRQSPRRQGFWVHAALAVSAEGLRTPLGLVSLLPLVHPSPCAGNPAPVSARAFPRDPAKESRRWADGVAAVRARASAEIAVHLMDREGDSYELLATLITHRDRFVIRLRHDRRVVADPDGPGQHPPCRVSDGPRPVGGAPGVVLSPRAVGHRSPAARRRHPSRPGRPATLRFAARPVVLHRPAGLGAAEPSDPRGPGGARMREVDPPPGEEPVDWQLVTTEPIDTVDDVLRIVDWFQNAVAH